ncbi:MAG: aldolase/citrate lyase family protein, partial [Pyramidobacter sp.]|nr:aldolase/citrate lyase family protein [Pyramidobacter sp.]
MRRSMLFLPGNTPNIIVNGDALGADAVILDLEDAVSPSEKDAARILVRNAVRTLGFSGVELIVRINSIDTPYWKDDLDEIVPLRPSLIM